MPEGGWQPPLYFHSSDTSQAPFLTPYYSNYLFYILTQCPWTPVAVELWKDGWVGTKIKTTALYCPEKFQLSHPYPNSQSLTAAASRVLNSFLRRMAVFPRVNSCIITILFVCSWLLSLTFCGSLRTYLVFPYIGCSFHCINFLYSLHSRWTLHSASCKRMSWKTILFNDEKCLICIFYSNTYDRYGIVPFLIAVPKPPSLCRATNARSPLEWGS